MFLFYDLINQNHVSHDKSPYRYFLLHQKEHDDGEDGDLVNLPVHACSSSGLITVVANWLSDGGAGGSGGAGGVIRVDRHAGGRQPGHRRDEESGRIRSTPG